MRRTIHHFRTVGMIFLLAATATVSTGNIAFAQIKGDDPVARSLYQRTLVAERTVNVAARVSTQNWGSAKEEPSVFDLLEGNADEYRMIYRAPATVAGRVVVYDGKTLHQYEPSRNLVVRRPLSTPPAPTKESAQFVKKSIFTRAPQKATIAGRPVTVVNRRYAQTGVLRERRWIDNKTYRTLQRDVFDENGKLTRRVRYETVSFEPKAPASAFTPNFPKTARILLASKEKTENAADIAKRVSLPLTATGYRVQSAVLVPNPAEQQLMYSDGVRSFSVFVSVNATPGASFKSGNGWKPDKTNKQLLVRNDAKTERNAVAWVYAGRRYVAVGRMPLGALLSAVRAMQPAASL